ncbi:hypothetical protein EV694_1621 [Volucribacter psittacicida]|uniref:DUF484 family protein n=1 Tax=Volucribacter psittacicida TaxID=203482 RepID=A0A4R1FT45_9PAST|nr:DUF484 family protein [Volucribacter psittacicida]TCJ98023.1 hypothetical protein EV694_1621 [Volucribacter psittacicida]
MTQQDLELATVQYLRDNPDFFQRHQTLLDELSVVHHKKGTLSLVEMQLQRQRDQIALLEARLSELTQLAEYNANIFFSLMPLQQTLSQSQTLEQGVSVLNNWADTLGLQQAKILLLRDSWLPIEYLPEQFWLDRKAFEIIRLERLGLRRFYLGQLTHKEKTLIFLPEELPVGSVAYCLLGQGLNQTSAVLLFSSHDENHFHLKQDTFFLQKLSEMVEAHLRRWLADYQK